MKKITIFLSVLLSVFILAGCGGTKKESTTTSSTQNEEISNSKKEVEVTKSTLEIENWQDNKLGNAIPKPFAGDVKVYNGDKYMNVEVKNLNKSEFKKYYSVLKSQFSIDSNNYSNDGHTHFDGYDKDGFRIQFNYKEKDKQLMLGATLPFSDSEFEWPTVGLPTLLPKPSSNKGLIDVESEEYFGVYVANTNEKEFHKYVNEVLKNGFDKDYNKGDKSFYGYNDKKDQVRIEYIGGENMYIHLSKSDE